MEKFAFFVLSLAAFTCVRIEASILDTTSDMCLEPILAQTHLTMCSKMGDFSECFRGSHVPSGDSVVLYDILHDMYESLYLFDSENCDLNGKPFFNLLASKFSNTSSVVPRWAGSRKQVYLRDTHICALKISLSGGD